MTNGFDRLERLFSNYKRKGSAPIAGEPISPIARAAIEQQFPSPSFIRPKASRMCAREERTLRLANGRSPSVPDMFAAGDFRGHARNAGSTDSSNSSQKPLGRSPSLNHHRHEPLMSGLRNFEFPKPSPSRDGSIRISPKHSAEAMRIPSPRCLSPLQVSIPPNRMDTPPSSDPEDDGSPYGYLAKKRLPKLPHMAPPTPEESPELAPFPEHKLRACKSEEGLGQSVFQDMFFGAEEPPYSQELRHASSHDSLAHSVRNSYESSTLREPLVCEFLELSDDDIAEDTATESFHSIPIEEPKQTLPSMGLSISQRSPANSHLTLTPPRATQPATAAAFEAARIARRYDFDLVYVVNLWPGQEESNGERHLIGRLLAAHGLHHVPSPLQISSKIHTDILRSDGWIEYRNADAAEHDLARGYGCGFYTGQYNRSGSIDSNTLVSGVRLSEQIDRGIVFAAYRKPRAGDSKLGHTFTDRELGDLHKDAEVLVEMLIDIHVANRLRQPPMLKGMSDETGPMPVQENPIH